MESENESSDTKEMKVNEGNSKNKSSNEVSIENKNAEYTSNLQGFEAYINKNKIKKRISKGREDKWGKSNKKWVNNIKYVINAKSAKGISLEMKTENVYIVIMN